MRAAVRSADGGRGALWWVLGRKSKLLMLGEWAMTGDAGLVGGSKRV